MENKKQWIKPQLIVLGRGMPEEKVLVTCKYQGWDGAFKINCKNLTGPNSCTDLASS
jgi:hypothetical protein